MSEKVNQEMIDEVSEDLSEETTTEAEVLEEELLEGEVEESLEEVDGAAKELEYRLKRLQADFDNFRKRTQGEKEQLTAYIKGEVLSDLLSVVDNFERALAVETSEDHKAFIQGFAMIQQNLLQILEHHGLKEIEALGQEFDPTYHQAVMNGPSDEYEDNQVCQVLQKGYTVNDRIVRPAMVKVTQN